MPQIAGADVWDDLLRSVRTHRHREARHLKPACLWVVADGLGNGSLDPDDLDPGMVIEALAAVLVEAGLPVPDRLWRPLWHLTNDGAWDFLAEGGRLEPADFGPGRKPETISSVLTRTDRIAVSPGLSGAWRSASGRETLQDGLLEMLADGDDNSRATARSLMPGLPASSHSAPALGRATRTQGRVSDVAVRRAVELRAMAVTAERYVEEGWIVVDVSSAESHDLLCTRGPERLLVEVKGTAGLGGRVFLTANEVSLAQGPQPTALAIVSLVKLARDGQAVAAHGGSLKIIDPWSPAQGDLQPVTYRYRVPAT
ncbi:DUF3883 domain-containing protein [Sphingomonas sp. 2R-10]|uniref:protein NO VEIN domain-containing protein n=1 Tax=Sphingomonas sp. 2R-10 TaxID=3045148 RepID=UPI000F7B5267|nr:DUF3883 domain-containing protein [Sphingomonas sp. 2R-10]MDJ0275410.1 DUF3883 domain-containing protein [Sphingomonas sp. 2R-10]